MTKAPKDNYKRLALEGMYDRRESLFDGIQMTTYGNRTLLVSPCGGVFRFKNDVDRMIIGDGMIKLQKIKNPFKEDIVYRDGEFYPTKNKWLMESGQLCGGEGEYLCFTLAKHKEFPRIIICNHQIQALFFYGMAALIALGESERTHSINHKDGVKRNNAPNNLEIITNRENTLHYHEVLKNEVKNGMMEGNQLPFILIHGKWWVQNPKYFRNNK